MQGLTVYPEYVARFSRIDWPVLVVYRFRILARSGEGKSVQYSIKAVTTLNRREAVESHRSSMLLSGWTASKSIRHQVRVLYR